MPTETDYYAVFGVENPETGAQAQEPAEPAAITGAQAQEPADPAQETGTEPHTEEQDPEHQEDGTPEGTGETGEPEGTPEKNGKQTMTPEQRRQNAARRRQEEQEKAVKDAMEKYKAQRDEEDRQLIAALGLKDPKTRTPITTREQVMEHLQEAKDRRLQANLAAGKLTRDDLEQVLMESPALQQLQKRAQEAEASNEAMAQQAFSKTAAAEIAEIHRLDPSVNGLQDIVSKPQGKDFIRRVQGGSTYLDAYRLAFWDDLQKRQRAAGEQAARNAAAGKAHLTATGGKGPGAMDVPEDVRKFYHILDPDASEEEIRKHYNKMSR